MVSSCPRDTYLPPDDDGAFLMGLKDEVPVGFWVTEYVALAPKFYALEYAPVDRSTDGGYIVVKAKGIRLTSDNKRALQPVNMKKRLARRFLPNNSADDNDLVLKTQNMQFATSVTLTSAYIRNVVKVSNLNLRKRYH